MRTSIEFEYKPAKLDVKSQIEKEINVGVGDSVSFALLWTDLL